MKEKLTSLLHTIKVFILHIWNWLRLAIENKINPPNQKAIISPQKAKRNFKRRILILGSFVAPSAIGALIGYQIGYRKTLKKAGEMYRFQVLPPLMRRYIFIGAISWVIIVLALVLLYFLSAEFNLNRFLRTTTKTEAIIYALLIYLSVSLLATFIAWVAFSNFLHERDNYYGEKSRYGTARFSYPKDLVEFARPPHPQTTEEETDPKRPKREDIYIGLRDGQSYVYSKQGHGLIIAGTRAGKGTKFIMPNLLGKAQYDGSWVIVDPKGESYWATHEYHRKQKRKVVIINPWGVKGKGEDLGTDTFNPLDAFTKDPGRKSLGNDMRVVAESLIPIQDKKSESSHFNDRARTLIIAMLMHMIIAPKYEGNRKISTLFEWLSRIEEVLTEMTQQKPSEYIKNQFLVSTYALQFLELLSKGEREFSSVISTAQRAVETFSDWELQDTMASSTHEGKPFTVTDLASKKMIIYIVIPPENLRTHSNWLRLIVSSCIRSILRKPGHRVGFILDEFYALGYMRDIEVGMGAYAGYNISLFPILQNLTQLQDRYPKTWETFLANVAFFNAFGLNDKTTTEYISKVAGQTSNVFFQNFWKSTARDLITPDEVRRGSANTIFSFIDRKPVANLDHLDWLYDPDIAHKGNKDRMY